MLQFLLLGRQWSPAQVVLRFSDLGRTTPETAENVARLSRIELIAPLAVSADQQYPMLSVRNSAVHPFGMVC